MDYAGAFVADDQGCFRLVYDEHCQPARCPRAVTAEGWFRDRSGRWHRVRACADHATQLTRRARRSG